MKQLVFIVAFLMIAISSNAQEKGSTPEERAKEYTEYIDSKMDLSRKERKFLTKTLTSKIAELQLYVKGSDYTRDEKKAFYKDSREWTDKELKSKFTDDEVKEISVLMNDYNKIKKKEKKDAKKKRKEEKKKNKQ